jgi:hypothetical protein
VFERKVLRRIYGPIQGGDIWRSRYCNFELYALYKEPKLAIATRIAGLRWAGHVQRMEDEQMPKRLPHAKTSGRRNVGRPISRWLDEVNTDVRRKGIRMWWRKALEREEWRKLLMEAKTLSCRAAAADELNILVFYVLDSF